MKSNCLKPFIFFITGMSACFVQSCVGQPSSGKKYLILQKEITLAGVKGRIDHIDVDVKNQVAYIAALGNNTVEAVDIKSGKVTGSIKGLDEPQGVAYIAKHKEIFVANGGTGECGFYDAVTLKKTGSIKLKDDADDVRYDADADRIYVGYGSGGIAIIDGLSHKLAGNIVLPSHPESFQLDTKAGKLWVNLPGSGCIGIADLKQLKLTAKWSKLLPRSNFPMAYDADRHRVIVGYRLPAKLIVYDSESGKEVFNESMVGDADDLYWDKNSKQIFVSGGGGSVNIFKQTGDSTYKQVANIETRNGARTSLLVPELGMLLIAARAEGKQNAALLIYKTNP
jgi:DNA-binding beta-propeller fold protein YncE